MKAALLAILVTTCVFAGQTTAFFNATDPSIGPFPSNGLTVADSLQLTGLRVNLPPEGGCDPSASPSICADSTTMGLLNQIDGFSVNPRIMACFSGAVNTSTLATGIQIVPVGGGAPVSVNQIIFDLKSNCAFAKPNQVLNQKSQYLLIVTNSVLDSTNQSVQQSPEFASCLAASDPYCESLANALGSSTSTIVAASLFTTMSATTWLEQARSFVDANQPATVLPAGLNGAPSVYAVKQLQSLTWVPAQGDSTASSQTITPSLLSNVGQVAFGMFLSPLFLDPDSGSILPTPTGQPIGAPTTYIPVSFHVFIPSGGAPRDGYPVAIYGHGLGDNQFGAPTYIAATLARFGIATLAFEITGHGYGAGSLVSVLEKNHKTFQVSTPGRGILLPGKSAIGQSDGCILPGALAIRDCGRQTAVDLSALVQTIRETNGLGFNLNSSRVYYIGQSFGGTYGTLFHAVDPNVKVAVLNGDGGTSVDVARLAITGRSLAIEYLASVNPALLNVDAGIALPEAYFHDDFNDNYVFRDTAPVTKTIAGAMAIQAAFEAAEWLGMPGDPVSFAPHLKAAPLAGVPVKSTLFQFGYGDLEVPNPTESAVIRAANAQSTASFFRFDKAAGIDPNLLSISMPELSGLPILPHRVLSNPTVFDYPSETPLPIAEQDQAATYFATSGSLILDPDLFLIGTEYAGSKLFQVPSSLPTKLDYFDLQP